MYKFLTTTFLIFFFANCYAQEYSHFSSWNRFVVQKKINDHWELMGDVHIRRQNDFTSSSNSPFSLKLMEGYRFTTIYRNHGFAFSFAPFFLHTYPLYAKTKDLSVAARSELRPSFFTEWSKNLNEKWVFLSRFGYEYRIFKRVDDTWGDEQGRIRLRMQIRYNWDENNTVFVSEEPLYNIPPHLPANSFSQNQLYFAFNHDFSPHFTAELGYMWNHRQRASLVEFDEENVLQTHFIFRL
ncbi:uncharacterized protein DUF2490 [Arcicella aurantiaca]|uniref:Uncharacterized protein DUF2490 n=1 Tax=Arcicella aurantiaca TaxID=591202 RepID=A0A316DN09_9BACT|nr:DUF2490 domain-containing protein [Arcicella aurantiaca]PWK19451.1 uncharacterized protein DUF2490 [Arcicella aurantiaca]